MAQIGRGSNKVSSTTGYQVDISEIMESLRRMDQVPSVVLREAAQLIIQAGKEILADEFEYAMDQQSEVAFPEEFRDHIRDVVSSAQFSVSANESAFEVGFDFNTLGTVKDLKRAFHQGAKTADGDVIDGPYEGEELNEPDAAKRHLYWEAMARGESKAPHPDDPAKSIRIKEGAWEETKQKYIEIWDDKAPQWLYLQFGQQKWEPTIKPSNIIEGFTALFNERAEEIFYGLTNDAILEAQINRNSYESDFGRRFSGNVSEIGPSGKPRKAGQFYFKGRR